VLTSTELSWIYRALSNNTGGLSQKIQNRNTTRTQTYRTFWRKYGARLLIFAGLFCGHRGGREGGSEEGVKEGSWEGGRCGREVYVVREI